MLEGKASPRTGGGQASREEKNGVEEVGEDREGEISTKGQAAPLPQLLSSTSVLPPVLCST